MNGFMRLVFVSLCVGVLAIGCATPSGQFRDEADPTSQDDFSDLEEPATDDPGLEADLQATESPGLDENFEEPAPSDVAQNQVAEDELTLDESLPPESPVVPDASQSLADSGADELSLDEDVPQAIQEQALQEPLPPAVTPPEEQLAPLAPPLEEVPPVAIVPPPAEVAPEAPPIAAPIEAPIATSVRITALQFRPNPGGGTIVVDADGPLTYSTRMNEKTRQFIVEIPNSKLPRNLTRTLNTRDFAGVVGSIDAYQSPGSDISRVVVQLREGSPEPVVQLEGNSLFVVATRTDAPIQTAEEATPQEESKLLSYASLDEFIAGNMQFYGKKISIEYDDMEIRDALKLIAEEAGINLIIADGVTGKINLKLREIPWDQALVMILKARKLGYTRAGSILRIAPIDVILAEEKASLDMAAAKANSDPLEVKLVPISYAKVEDLQKQIEPFLNKERGKVVADARTSSLLITDTAANIARAMALIRSIDLPPQQVLIEGKIVEASSEFNRQLGIRWNNSGRDWQLGNGGGTGNSNIIGSTQVSVDAGTASVLGLNFRLGTFDVLGDLAAQLTLFERQGSARILSSPRVTAIHNEAATITQTTSIPILTTTQAAPGVAPVPTVNFRDLKLSLNVTPQITNNGSVIMKVDMNRDVPSSEASPGTGAVAVSSRSANTRILVRNGQTAVIGGIFQNDITNTDTKVPWLGDIPFLGWLFKSNTKRDQRNELMIFLTPRILDRPETQVSQGGELDLESEPANEQL